MAPPPSLSEQLKQTFDLASHRHQADKYLKGEDWEAFRAIKDRYANARQETEKRYITEYDTRVSKVLQKLIDKAGAKNKTFKHRWFGNDQFNRADLVRKAHQFVQLDHQQTLWKLESHETRELGDLINTAQERQKTLAQSTEVAREHFKQATDRRQGVERRSGPSR